MGENLKYIYPEFETCKSKYGTKKDTFDRRDSTHYFGNRHDYYRWVFLNTPPNNYRARFFCDRVGFYGIEGQKLRLVFGNS